MDLSTPDLIALLAGTMLALVVGTAIRDRLRHRPRRTHSAADAYLTAAGPPSSALPYGVPTSLRLIVAAGALAAAIAAGASLGTHNDQTNRNRSDAALANLQRCNTVVNANWRRAIDVFLLGYSVTSPHELAAISSELGLPDDPGAVKAEGRARIAASLADDARLDALERRLCPFAPGDPTRTPDTPVESATARLNAELERQTREHGTPATLPHDPDTTTTTTQEHP